MMERIGTRRSGGGVVVAVLVIVLAVVLSYTAIADEYTATTMRLLRFEGSVEIEDAAGAARSVMKNARFSSGETMRTGAASLAAVGLDADKAVTLDEKSCVEFIKNDKVMEMTLKEGSLLLDVQKKLESEESLDVKTSTMVIGIRGTVIGLDQYSGEGALEKDTSIRRVNATDGEGIIGNSSTAASGTNGNTTAGGAQGAAGGTNGAGAGGAQGGTTKLCVFEGTAEAAYRNADGGSETVMVPAGKKIMMKDDDGDGMADVKPVVEDMGEEDLSAFVLGVLGEDSALMERVGNASGVIDFLAQYRDQADWKWESKVTLVAQSASKFYDGMPLMREGDVLVYGLPQQFRIEVSAEGSRTDAGTGANTIGTYAIYNAFGEDVTGHFSNVETVAGALTVDPAPLTIWTGSASKYYDGQALVNREAGLYAVPGHRPEDPLWRNTSYVAAAGQNGGADADVQVLYGVCGVVRVHGTNPITGEVLEETLYAGQKMTVFLSDKSGKPSIDFRIERVSVDEIPDELLRLYADNPEMRKMACSDANWDPKEMEEQIAAMEKRVAEAAAGGQAASQAGNAAEQAKNDQATPTENSETAQARNGQAPAQPRTATSGSGQAAPQGGNGRTDYVTQKDLQVVKDCADRLMTDFTNVHIMIDTDITDYNDRALGSQETRYSGIAIDEKIKVRATGSQTKVGSSKNTYTIDWNGVNPENYSIKEDLGTLTVRSPKTVPERSTDNDTDDKENEKDPDPDETPEDKSKLESTLKPMEEPKPDPDPDPEYKDEVTITAGSASKTYDGTPLTSDEVEIKGLPDGFTCTATVKGSQTDAGTGTNSVEKYQILDANGKDVTSRFTNVSVVDGELTVEPRLITVVTEGGQKIYDGSELTNEAAHVEGLPESQAGSVTVKATGSITDAGEVENDYSIDWGGLNSDNYVLTEELGKLVVEPLTVIFDLHMEGYTYELGEEPFVVEWFNARYEGGDVFEGEITILDIDGVPYGTVGVFGLVGGGTVEAYFDGISVTGEHTLFPDVQFSGTKESNFAVECVNNKVRIVD